jgi:tRNA pseudouridine synthase 10
MSKGKCMADGNRVGWNPIPNIKEPASINIKGVYHDAIFIGGRYKKLKRHVSHSPWFIGGKKKTEHSVEELIHAPLQRRLNYSDHKFGSSGREDANVLMLGDGRPFYFECKDPKILDLSLQELQELQSEINQQDMIQVNALSIVSREQVKALNDSVEKKTKSYRMLVQLSNAVSLELLESVSQLTDLAIQQQNPSRVPR